LRVNTFWFIQFLLCALTTIFPSHYHPGYRRDDDDYNVRNDRPRFSEPRGNGRGYDSGGGRGQGRNSMGSTPWNQQHDVGGGGDKRNSESSSYNRRSDRNNPRQERPNRDSTNRDDNRYTNSNTIQDKETSSLDRGKVDLFILMNLIY
jgi:hypothetical protein